MPITLMFFHCKFTSKCIFPQIFVCFSGHHVWSGFTGPAQLSTLHFKELTGSVNAAFRMHNTENPDDHDHIYLFQVPSALTAE